MQPTLKHILDFEKLELETSRTTYTITFAAFERVLQPRLGQVFEKFAFRQQLRDTIDATLEAIGL